MTVGNQATEASVNQALSSLSTQMRELMTSVQQQQKYLNNLNTAGLEALGYSPADAASVLQMINYMGTVSGCYFGTVQQGGSGGAGAILFNFDTALCGLWAGQ